MRRATNGQIIDAHLTSVFFLVTTMLVVPCPSTLSFRGIKSPSMQFRPETTLSKQRAETFHQDNDHTHSASENFVVDFWIIYFSHATLDVCRSAGEL